MAELQMPPIYLLATHIEPDVIPQLESQIPTLTFDIQEAEIILGKISKKERAMFELRKRGIISTEVVANATRSSSPPAKRRKVSSPVPPTQKHDDSGSTASENEDDAGPEKPNVQPPGRPSTSCVASKNAIKVVHLSWFTDSVSKRQVLPLQDYIIYQGQRKTSETTTSSSRPVIQNPEEIVSRAKEDGNSTPRLSSSARSGFVGSSSTVSKALLAPKRPALLHETTSEHEYEHDLPPIPDYLNTIYSCQRPTPFNPPNEAFIDQLKKVRTIRALTGDKVGVRAYSSSIASLAAYPYVLRGAHEVSRLPGCGPKIAVLFREWNDSGRVEEVDKAARDHYLGTLSLFYEIWGVAETTAREFYNKGWRDLDDIVEFGWDSLSRVQQIGVKYYDEFLSKIPRAEVEAIANTILERANSRREGFQMVIVGGYRRGKEASGDVDVVLSHPDSEATHYFVEELVMSLEKDNFITHTLTLSTKNSERGQAPLAWKGGDRKAGSGFDTLDKALVVWQDPHWDKEKFARNPNPHRRVDIIISPWKTVGCAVIGWSGGTTFQRDLRRYCKTVKGLKFDSSGIRSRADGHWLDLESHEGRPAPDLLAAEKRVFAGLDLEWRPPTQRCTG
ncbi:hypothetical protein PFICI_08359 [Pestalotiopsis fici W106-1]|uniref:DNA polymerase n=1 Tax=Pestalotiopsis fici (strain W106-1 / CGMCC3.15140) TaxID=1229662 RepID=W3X447_PESFW|nr:uncharacterized protein PFICI_08359 [Pestalotiopsis fici W106-1]ETS80830.1 hypothetical protein PFICI_08359 [Pestalotiopsis fici W106-1]